MLLAPRRGPLWLPLLATLALGFLAEPAFAQRGCTRQSRGQSSLRTTSYISPQPYLSQASVPWLQQYAAQSQLSALRQYDFMAQLNAAPLIDPAAVDLLQAQLDDLKDFIAEQKADGTLTAAQLKALRQQERTLASLLRTAKKRTAASQSTQTLSSL